MRPLHLGLEHPNLRWLVAASILAFCIGLAIRTYTLDGRDSTPPQDHAAGGED